MVGVRDGAVPEGAGGVHEVGGAFVVEAENEGGGLDGFDCGGVLRVGAECGVVLWL